MGKKIIKDSSNNGYVQLEKSTLLAIDGTNTVEVFPVDYIESTGTQYIDTNIIPTGNSKIELELKTTSGNPSWASIFGSSSNSFGLQRSSSNNSWATYLLGSYNLNLGSWAENTNYNLVFDGKNSKFVVNGTSYNINKGSTQPSATLKLLTAWNLETNVKAQVKKVKLYDNDELQLDLIPVKYGTEYCMLDLVEGKLYHNDGTGTFTGGSELSLGTPVKQLSTQKAGWLDGDTFTTYENLVTAGPIVYTSKLSGGIETLDDGAYRVLETPEIEDDLYVERASDNARGTYNIETHTFTVDSSIGTDIPYEKNIDIDNLAKFTVDDVEYKKLDYIEALQSGDKQYINLNIACNLIKNIELEFMGTSWSSDQVMYGAYSTTSRGGNYLQVQSVTRIFGNNSGYQLLARRPSTSKKCKLTTPITSTGMAYFYEDDIQVGSANIPDANGETLPMMLFTLNYLGSASASHYTKMKVYSFKGWGLDDKLLFDLIPSQRLSDGVLGMFDSVSNTFFTNSGTGTFTAGPTKGFDIEYKRIEAVYDEGLVENVKEKKIKLPEYQILDYIQTDGANSYINTNIYSNDIGYFKLKMNAVSGSGFFGCFIQNYNVFYINANSGKYRMVLGTKNTEISGITTTLGTDITVEYNNLGGTTWAKLNEQTLSSIGIGNDTNNSLYLGKLNMTGTQIGITKVYSFEVKDKSGNDLRNFIPVKKLSDNSVGLFDTVNKVFYGNANSTGTITAGTPTGDFIYNENPEEVIPVEYIESSGTQFIETLSNFTNTKRLKIKWLSNSDIVQYGHDIMGKNTSSDTYNFIVQERHDSTKLVLINNKPNSRIDTTQTTLKEHVLEVDWRTLPYQYNLDGAITTKNSAIQDFGNYNLFKASDDSRLAKAKIYYYECYDSNNELSFNLIPVKTATTEYCMLDLVNMQLYHNKGTGSFTGKDYDDYTGKYKRLHYFDVDSLVAVDRIIDSFETTIRALKPSTYISGAIKLSSNGTKFLLNDTTELTNYDNEAHKVVIDKENGKLYFDAVSYDITGNDAPVIISDCRLSYFKSFKDTELTSWLLPVNIEDGKILLDIYNKEKITSTYKGDKPVRLRYIDATTEKCAPKYEEVEWIESDSTSGNQYIDLGTRSITRGSTKVECGFKFNTTSSSSTAYWVFNHQNSSASNPLDVYTQSNYIVSRINGNPSINKSADTNNHTWVVDLVNNKFIYDGEETSISPVADTSGALNLFRRNTNTGYSQSRIYYFKKYENNVLELDLIPVYNRELDEYGLYDKVTDTYYGNSGTGKFNGQRKETPTYFGYTTILPVKYLENTTNTNGQCINTNILLQRDDRIKFKVKINEVISDKRFFGSVVTNNGVYVGVKNSKLSFRVGQTEQLSDMVANADDILEYDISLASGNSTCKISKDGTLLETLTSTETKVMPDVPLYLFCSYTVSDPSNYSKINIYDFTVIRNNAEIINYTPVLDLSNNEPCLYDSVTDTLFRNRGTGNFNYGAQRIIIMDPQYRQVEYIQGTKTDENNGAYINTKYNPTANGYKAKTKVLTTEASAINGILGINDNTSGAVKIAGVFFYSDGKFDFQYGTGVTNAPNYSANTIYELEMSFLKSDTYLTVNGTKYSYSNTGNRPTDSVYVLGLNRRGTLYQSSSARMYYCQLFDENDNLVRYFIPVIRMKDLAVGMLDLVENKFYGNDGTTGEFIAGPLT